MYVAAIKEWYPRNSLKTRQLARKLPFVKQEEANGYIKNPPKFHICVSNQERLVGVILYRL